METRAKSTAGAGDRRDRVGSLDRGLEVLAVLARHPAGLTLTGTADRLGMTRAGARRLLLTLASSGWAVQEGRLFRLSPLMLSLARDWLDGQSLWTYALGPMREVAARFNEACSAAVLADEDVVYVARVPGERIVSVDLRVGTRLPAYCTSMGRVLLSGLGEDAQRRFLAGASLPKNTPKTVTDPGLLMDRFRQVAAEGYALVDEELEIGLRSIAVPLRDRSGRIVAAINVSTQSARLSADEMVARILPPLKEAARRIEDFFLVQ